MSKYGLALDEARRALDRQSADLSGIRDRAATLLGIGGTLAGVLGGLAIRDGASLSSWTYAAIFAFVALATVSVFILWPRKATFSHDPAALIRAADVIGATTDDVVEHLARQMGTQYETNKTTLDRLVIAFCVAVVVFGIQVLALLIDLRGR